MTRHPSLRRVAVAACALALALGAIRLAARQTPAPGRLIFVGTYTGEASKGIYAFRFDDTSGALTPLGLAVETASPSFLALSPNGRVLFAVNEVSSFEGAKTGSVSSFAIDPAKGRLTPINVQPSGGAAPCHLQCDRTGRFLAVANYSGGNFAVFPVAADGRLGPAAGVVGGTGSGPNKARQEGPHGHEVVFAPDNRFLLAADLGLDRVFVYRFDSSNGRLTPNEPPSASLAPGSGPRHLAFDPNGRFVYVISEMASTLSAFSWDGTKGVLSSLGTVSTLPDDFHGNSSTAEVAVHPNGRFVYGSNRGHDSIAVFGVGGDGRLTLVEHEPTRGRTPRNFSIDPTGRWLIAANQNSGTLAVFSIDQKTGALTPVGPLATVGSPVCVLFMP